MILIVVKEWFAPLTYLYLLISLQDSKGNKQDRTVQTFSENVHDAGPNDKNGLVEKIVRNTCHCSTMDRQQREIVTLKRKLQEREVYGPSAKGAVEDR